ncbi:MAG: dockerin type I repeat-containing protein [Clostridia bacterium]|nr:dockerin type I repeat-containing protein [Clostridia bacterium]
MLLRKVIATVLGCALLANTGMILSANAETETTAETTIIVEADETPESAETTVVSTAPAEESTTTTTDTTSLEDVGAAIRESLDIKVRDIVIFDEIVYVYDAKDTPYYVDFRWRIWINGIDDANQRFRVQVPNVTENGDKVTYLKYSDAPRAVVVSHEGRVIGDLNNDGCINAKDFTLLKRYLLYEEDNHTQKLLSDMNADGEVNMSDLVLMQKWLLCIK